jgi:type IV secretion system protein VirD4
MMDNNHDRYGSARWSHFSEQKAAGLTQGQGVYIGCSENAHPLHIDSDAAITLIGGSGSQKLVSYVAYTALLQQPTLYLDVKGEITALMLHSAANLGMPFYAFNPYGLFSDDAPWYLPQHKVNVLDFLSLDSPYLSADISLLMESCIASPAQGASGSSDFFVKKAREWGSGILHYLMERMDVVTLPDWFNTFSLLESDMDSFNAIVEGMKHSRFMNVRRMAGELSYKRENAQSEYSGVMSTVFANINILGDPVLQESLSGSDFSCTDLCDERRPCKASIIVPAEHISVLKPVIKLLFTAAMICKQRQPQAPQVLFVVDEAPQLGSFPELLRAYVYGRGAGLRMFSLWQDIGQIERCHGHNAIQTLLGSSQTRIFTGIRDNQSARLISDMLGSETLSFDSLREQAAARRNKIMAIHSLMNGSIDPIQAVFESKYYAHTAQIQDKQERKLATPDEILNMPDDCSINFVSDRNLYPFLGQKVPYYTHSRLAGWFLPNPYRPYSGFTHAGNMRRKVITQDVPPAFAHLPQYQKGALSFIDGYYPRLPAHAVA